MFNCKIYKERKKNTKLFKISLDMFIRSRNRTFKILLNIISIVCMLLRLFSTQNGIFCLKVQFSAINEAEEYISLVENDNYKNLDEKTYYVNENSILIPFNIPLALENEDQVTIYIENEDLYAVSYFFNSLTIDDNIFVTIKPQTFFKILKYLNIFKVMRNMKYKSYIKILVYYSLIHNLDFKNQAFKPILNHLKFNNLHVRDVIECFLKLYMMKKAFIYELFREYNQPKSISSIFYSKKHRKNDDFLFMKFHTRYLYKYLLKPNFRDNWTSIMHIFLVKKLYLNLCAYGNNFDMKIICSSLPKNFEKIIFVIVEELLPIFNYLQNNEYFTSKDNVKFIIYDNPEYFIDKIFYFKSIKKLTLEINQVYIEHIIKVENLTIYDKIESLKLILYSFSSLILQNSAFSLSGRNKKFFIDLENTVYISDLENQLEFFQTYNFQNYLTKVNLCLFRETYDTTYFAKIFNFNLIKFLKIDLENVQNNFLVSYKFLESFEALRGLSFENIKLTNKLFEVILCSRKLTTVLFDNFMVFDENELINQNLFNNSILFLGFYNLNMSLNSLFFLYLSKFAGLKRIILNLHHNQSLDTNEYCFNDEVRYLNIPKPKNHRYLPSLESLKYGNFFFAKNQTSSSILKILYNLFNLENLIELKYNTGCLYKEDIEIFSNLKSLKYLKLSIQNKSSDVEILRKILRLNISNKIFKLDIYAYKFEISEILSISNFKKLKILKLTFDSDEIIIRKNLGILYRMNFIKLDIYKFEINPLLDSYGYAKKIIFSSSLLNQSHIED
ncbi:hypothetical protein CWI36_0103p0010 [Hamiltosporidium magnivora]|uniref:Uncharacterized protein n=1 Tax=Hamiltosporidium magnivora TaxID=148818 RepID=A0A4Q9LMK1_9MICR|nr:hypothetical protein CWI36_0103p0010 [Hamiltosporidium magnivora]